MLIEVKNLKKTFDDGKLTVLKDINFTIEQGDIYGLVGRSGAGKSTLLRCINGLTSYQEGSLLVNSREVKDLDNAALKKFRSKIGMIFQHFSLLERKNVYDNIALPMKCWGYSKSDIDKKVKELVALVGIADKLYVKPRTLSGGQKQRVAIARALSLDPDILLCDEATSALDPKTTKSILNLLSEINTKTGITMVIVTHQMSVVRQICNKVSILEQGCIAEKGKVTDIFLKQPPALQRLVGTTDIVLPEKGRNIQVLFNCEEVSQSEIFTRMAVDLQTVFPIIDGSVSRYREDVMGTFIINLKEDQFDSTTRYLSEKSITWKELIAAKEEEE